jgi:NADH dehydrogenase/NADH:ubiquinone oxidoreductase subunit G
MWKTHPCLDVFVPHVCLVLYEHACCERAAHLILDAANYLEECGSFVEILGRPSPWQKLTRPGSKVDTTTGLLRQLGMLALLLPQMARLSTSALRVCFFTTAHRRACKQLANTAFGGAASKFALRR